MTTQRAKLFASIPMLAVVCALCAQPLRAERKIPIDKSRPWRTWISSDQFYPKFSSMSWPTYRDEVLFPPNAKTLKNKKGDEPYRHLAPGTIIVFPDLGDASKAEADRLRAENKNLNEKIIPKLRQDLADALAAKRVPWYQSWWMIALYALAAGALGFVIASRMRGNEPIVATRLWVDDNHYDAAAIRILLADQRSLENKVKRLEAEKRDLEFFVQKHGYRLDLPGNMKRMTGDFRHVYLLRDPVDTERVYVRPPDRGPLVHNALTSFNELDDVDLLNLYDVQRDTVTTRRI